ncbi:hypothetical protein M758_10G116800 [Ceratodon purpureus]|nr:hypothetical protein M758_10G116800 [Ceratodon purpureus]
MVTAKIQPIDRAAVHRICSGQVVLDLATAVKELVENSLDAEATSVEIRLKEYGSVLIEVADNGCGVSPENYQGLTLKYHTSKISEFADLQTLSSFGFRGEALSSLCALSDVSVTTRTKEEPVGARLMYDHSGALISQERVARAIGTTVAVSKLFSPLPVRYKEFNRNIRREYGRLLSILQAYALIAKGVRIVCTNQVGKSGRTTIVQTQGSGSVKDNIITVFGSKTATCLEPLDLLVSDGCRVEGFVSRPGAGCGRASGDRQFVYVNGRPVDLPKINKLLNELYGSFNSLQKPMAVLNFILAPTAYDVNVTPDKRKVFLHTEGALLIALREVLENVYTPEKYTYAVNNLGDEPTSTKQKPGSAGVLDSGHESSIPQEDSDEEAPESPKGEVSARGAEESQDFSRPKNGTSGRRTSFEIRTASPSTSGQEKRPKSDFLNLLSFKLKGPKTGASGKGIADAPAKTSNVSRNSSKIMQSRLTGFVSTSKKSTASERDIVVSAQKDAEMEDTEEMEDAEELETIEPVPDSAMNVVDITAVNPIHEHVSCCVDHPEDTSVLVVSKPKLVIGLGQTEAGNINDSEEAIDLDKDDDFVNLDEEVAKLSSLNKSKAIEVVGPCSLDQPSNLQVDTTEVIFDIKKLRLKGRRGLLHFEDEAAVRGKPLKRMRGFTAATLEADGVTKGGAEKEAALVAATKELERSFNKADFKQMKVVGQFNLGFILAKLDQDLFIVDQHASDEKYNFERLSKTTVLNKQPLMRPLPVELSAAEEVIVSTHIETFRQNGFDFVENENAPPGRRLQLSAVPFSKNITFGIGDVQELVGILANESAPVSRASPTEQTGSQRGGLLAAVRPSRVRGMLASRACRSSIMIGDALCKKEMEKILCHLADLDAPWNCPHGRPTMRHLADLTALRER